MTQELAITNSEKPCLVDNHVSQWFEGKVLTLDDEGVYYTVERKRYYVHDQVINICIKRGTMERIQPPRRMRMYVTASLLKGRASSEGLLFFGKEEKGVRRNTTRGDLVCKADSVVRQQHRIIARTCTFVVIFMCKYRGGLLAASWNLKIDCACEEGIAWSTHCHCSS